MTGKATSLLACALCVSSCGHHSPVLSRAVRTNSQQGVDRSVVNAVDAGDGDYDLRRLRAALDANPGDLKARFALARRYQSLGFSEVAIEHGRLAVERVPDSEEARVELARLFWAADRSLEGAKSLGEFAKSHELGVSGLAWLGLLRDASGDWKGGEAAYRKALALQPGRDDLHNNLGFCLLSQGNRKEAEEEFRTAVRLDPRSVVARNNLGSVLTGNPSEAVANLQSVTDPATAHSNLAAALIEAGKYAEARRELDEALRYNRQHPAALSNLELVSRLDGKPADLSVLPGSGAARRAAAGQPVPPRGSWVARAWHRMTRTRGPQDRISNSNDAGRSIASRQKGE